jgi:hypothetical protein
MNLVPRWRIGRPVVLQILVILFLLSIFIAVVQYGALSWDNKVSIAAMLAIPSAVIIVAQLIVSNLVQRSSYIKDYALKFRSDRELTESYHFLVYRYGNEDYEDFKRSRKETMEKQVTIPDDLRFFDPKHLQGCPQERRLDNLLGFFDALGYDHARGLINIEDIAGLFGLQFDHFIQRRPIQDYMKYVREGWPNIDSFHTEYSAPIPFRYFSKLCTHYLEYRKITNPVRR